MNPLKLFARHLWRNRPTTRRRLSTQSCQRTTQRFRPSFLTLEDRTVPSADMFASATVLTGVDATSTDSNVGATAETGEPDPFGSSPINSIWWQWTAPSDGMVEVNSVGSQIDTVLGVYTGSSVDALTEVGANDDFYDLQSRVQFQAVASTTYYFWVDGYADTTGSITLNLAMAPPNDNFADAIAIGTGTYTGSNIGATAEVGEPPSAGTSAPINSVWWSWMADQSGTVEFNTFGSELDTLLAVYSGSSLTDLQLLAANDDTDGLQSQVLVDAVAGTTYYIAIDGASNQTGGIILNHPAQPTGTNHAPTVATGQSFTVQENAPGGTVVGTVTAADSDQGQILTYSIIGGNTSDAFTIDRATGELKVQNGAALDYETNPTFDLLIQVTDNGDPSLSASATVTINLDNGPDAPTFVSTGPFMLAENSPDGTAVGTVSATDPDPGQTVSYAIAGGNTSGAFAIDPTTGQITVANSAAIDYETNPVFALSVTATDDGAPALSSNATVIVFIDDGNDPPQISDQTFALDENSPNGTVAAMVKASDPDAGQTLTYSIVAGNDTGAFTIDSTTGWITVANRALLDYETTTSFALTIQVTDSASLPLSSTALATINLNDVNELATFVESGPFSVEENVPAGTFVGAVAATDPDGGQSLTYAIVGGNINSAFAIDAITGEITVANAAALDFETRSSFSLTVRALDDGSPALAIATTVVITLIDVNDAPVLDTSGAMSCNPINQGAVNNAGTLVSDLIASAGGDRIRDQDAGAVEGIAIINADTTYGSWKFSTDGGTTWSELGAVSTSSARLLAADSLTRVRFVPVLTYNGTVSNALTFRAWDQTTGVNGDLADASMTGGRSAFSSAAETTSIKVRSAVEQIDILSSEVQSLVYGGFLSQNNGSQLLSKLKIARKLTEQGNGTAAISQLNNFINTINNMVSSGELPPAYGDDLIAKANDVIVSIQSSGI